VATCRQLLLVGIAKLVLVRQTVTFIEQNVKYFLNNKIHKIIELIN